eukprot:scaffold100876_cov36-Tisochrysis_lutea.AAC.1
MDEDAPTSALPGDAFGSILRLLPLPSQLSVAGVCRAWQEGTRAYFAEERRLDLSGVCTMLTDDALQAIVQLRPQLCELNLYGCRRISDRGLAVLHGCRSLRRLNICCLPLVTSEGVAALTQAVHLDDLDLSGCTGLCLDVPALTKHFEQYLEMSLDEDGLDAVQG